MFSGKQFGVLGVIVGANLLLSLLVSTVGGSLGVQGPTGQTGPQGPQGSTGETGEDGHPVEFRVEDNVLQWRYVGETEWNDLDLEISGGGSSTVNLGGTDGFFSHWVFSVNPNFQFDYPARAEVTNSATYAQNLITNEGYTGVSSLAALEAIGDSVANLSGKYVLTADIDLATWTPTPANANNVIRREFGSFSGVLDGAGYTLSNYTINDTTGSQFSDIGLFYELQGAEISNLNLENFSVNLTGELYGGGALSAQADTYNSKYTVIDRVNLDGFEVTSTNNINDLGGLVGDINEGIKIYRSTSSNMTVATGGNIYALGGMFGYVDTEAELELFDLDTQLEVIVNDPDFLYNFDRVGGLGGNVQNNATILAYRVNSEFVGPVRTNSSAFIGNVAGYSQVILKEITVDADISRSDKTFGNQTGGLFGFYGRDGMLFIDDVQVTGDIRGYNEVGGFIGHAKEGSVIKITNSSMLANLEGEEEIGGLVGILENDRHRWMFENNTIDTTITVYQEKNSSSTYSEDIGGLIGYVDSSDSSDLESTNQILVEDVEVMVDVVFDIQDFEAVDSAYKGLGQVGGMFGEVYENNQVRVINSNVVASVDFILQDISKFEYTYLEIDSLGGVVGYIDETTLMLVNVTATLDVNILIQNMTPETTATNTNLYVRAYLMGGAIGESSEHTLIIVEGSYDLSFVQTVSNVSSPVYNYEFDTYRIGGLVGDFDDSVLLGESFETSLFFDVTIDDITLGDGFTLDIEIYEVGALLGDPAGSVAFLDDVTVTSTATADVQEVVENKVSVRLDDLTNDVGRVNPFIVIN